MEPEDFVKNIIVKRLNPLKIIVGHDFGFGANKSGNIALLKKLSEEFGFELAVVEPVVIDNDIVSSTLIRRLVVTGKVCAVKRFLGRDYSVKTAYGNYRIFKINAGLIYFQHFQFFQRLLYFYNIFT